MITVWERKCSFFEHFRPETVILLSKIGVSGSRVTSPK
jgi:hypothetical protein